jgi:hypothetical protein
MPVRSNLRSILHLQFVGGTQRNVAHHYDLSGTLPRQGSAVQLRLFRHRQQQSRDGAGQEEAASGGERGWSTHYREFFRKVKELLAEDGVMLLHATGRMEPQGSTNPLLHKYIFPGGYTPALPEVLSAVEDVGLWVTRNSPSQTAVIVDRLRLYPRIGYPPKSQRVGRALPLAR